MAAQAYEIRVEASANLEWMSLFEEVCIIPLSEADFILKGIAQDEPALHGLLGRIRAAGLILKSVQLTAIS